MGSERVTRLGKRSFRPEELSALVLRSLKEDAEKFLGESVTAAVITVPAYFNDKQRKATRRAGQLAGLNVERLLNEPTAAALAYGIHNTGAESKFLVFDLGGGTFDVSVLELFEGVIEVRSSTGDNRLGGEDFNALLIELFARAHREALGNFAADDTSALYQRVREQAERCRRSLSTEAESRMRIVWEDKLYELKVDAETFEKACAALIERLRIPVMRALQDGQVKVDALNEIVLVGGATRMSVVKRAVTKMFGRFPAAHVNPDEAVAMGAAIQAGLKARDIALKEVVLTDVCPYTLGVAINERLPSGNFQSGVFAPVIERNTIVPASREKEFATLFDGQRLVEVQIYQGESRKVADNIHLGKLEIPVPPGPAGSVVINCRFTYDINGILEVDLHVPATGQRRELVIVDDPSAIEPAELERRRRELAALKIHPREDHVNQAALTRLERCYEQSLGDRREAIGRWLTQFHGILEGQNTRLIADARAKLIKAMDSLEGESYL
jgi:molecular chaperone HscC